MVARTARLIAPVMASRFVAEQRQAAEQEDDRGGVEGHHHAEAGAERRDCGSAADGKDRREQQEARRRDPVADPAAMLRAVSPLPHPPSLGAMQAGGQTVRAGVQAALAFFAASIASTTMRRASSASPHWPMRTHFSDSRSL
jgi:hypothetical protein